MADLPWEYRELIVLRHFGELSYEEIATLKEPDLNAHDMDAAVKIIAGTARSMGIEVEG